MSTALSEKIHQANREAHDKAAQNHDRSVPYIQRPSSRKYYWMLIKKALAEKNVNVEGARVLEVGCGTGTFTPICFEEGALAYHGIDLSPGMIELAKHKAQSFSQETQYEVSSLEAYVSEHQQQYDIILSSSFLHHLEDVDAGIKGIRSMLKAQGVYVAIHEINSMPPNFLSRLNRALCIRAGYNGDLSLNKAQKTKKIIDILIMPYVNGLRVKLGGIRRRLLKGKKQQTKVSSPVAKEIDYVDFQLNQPFSLSEYEGLGQVVKSYRYLDYVELLPFLKKENYQMLVADSLSG